MSQAQPSYLGLAMLAGVFVVNEPEAQGRSAAEASIVVLEAGGDRPSAAAGIVFHASESDVLVATARHAVWSSEGPFTRIRGSFHDRPGEWFDGEVLSDASRSLDLAVVKFARRMKADLQILGSVAELDRGAVLHAMGYADGVPRKIAVTPELFAGTDGQFFEFESRAVSDGSSGGGVFDSEWRLIGMTLETDTNTVTAARIEDVAEQLEKWSYPVGWSSALRLGWHGETMPAGMKKSAEEGEYVWLKDGSTMVFVPAGTFDAGDLPTGSSYRMVAEKLHVNGFYIDKFEVSRGDFGEFVRDSEYQTDAEKNVSNRAFGQPSNMPTWNNTSFPQTDDHAVTAVSWNDANQYAKWAGKTLPTETQWEKAALWDDVAKKKHKFPWGDKWPLQTARVNLLDATWVKTTRIGKPFVQLLDGYAYTGPVDSFEAGRAPCGAYNMVGNVAEWLATSSLESRQHPEDMRKHMQKTNPQFGDRRVLAGGSYGTESVVGMYFFAYPRDVSRESLGFRCAVPLQ